ncbi:MAG TPA: hypothetical protein VNW52_07140 [Burkholderiaceae bacterium]|jgi:hypothetical protein|nr:hypothetical protein [Burkholderiaceae bacterium]
MATKPEKRNWLLEYAPHIIIPCIGAVLAVGAWILIELYRMNASEAKMDAKLNENSVRIDRIAAVLPDVRIKIAKEELSKPISVAVVVRDPAKTTKGKWITAVQVIDNVAKTQSTYALPVNGPDDKEIGWLTGGAATDSDSEAVSFKLMSAWSSDSGVPSWSPSDVLVQSSFVLRKPSTGFSLRLAKMYLDRGATVQVNALNTDKTSTYMKLIEDLSKNPVDYSALSIKVDAKDANK